MTHPGPKLISSIVLIVSLFGSAAAAADNGRSALAVMPARSAAPHLMIQNVGQYEVGARFMLINGDMRVWLADDAIWMVVPGAAAVGADSADRQDGRGRHARRLSEQAEARSATALRFTFPGANLERTLEPFGPQASRVSYLIGNDPAGWQRNVPVWSGVRYRDLYPGVDLVIGGDASGAVPWRFEARPGAAAAAVALRVEGSQAVAAEAGALQVRLAAGELRVALPAWTGAAATPTGAAIVQQAGVEAFDVAAPFGPAPDSVTDDSTDLIYSTFLGGADADTGNSLAVDWQGNAYVTGDTDSTAFPTMAGAYDEDAEPREAFVAKFNSAGTALLYATFLGGSSDDIGWGIAVSGNLAYAVGETWSTDFPGTSGTMGENDLYVVALNADGTAIRYARLLGRTGYDYGYGIAVEDNIAYVVGSTYSVDTAGNACGGSSPEGNAVVAKLNAAGAPAYTTCFGGSDLEEGYAIAVLNGVAYVTGESRSSDFGDGAAGGSDILFAKLGSTGTLSASKLVGGESDDRGNGIAVDGAGNSYIIGGTQSADFPKTNGAGLAGGIDAAVVKLSSAAPPVLNFGVYMGGSGDDEGWGIALDTVQGLYLTGVTESSNFPTTAASAYDTSSNGGSDLFIARMHLSSSTLNKLTYSTFFGAAGDDTGYSAATDTAGHAFVTGMTSSSPFPVKGAGGVAYDTGFGGIYDAFAAKLLVSSPPAAPAVTITANGTTATLSWPAVPSAVKYQVFRSSLPYFKPGDWAGRSPWAEPTGTSYPDSGALTPATPYFYVVKAVSAAPEAGPNSNRVGQFTYALVKGTN